MKFFVVNPSSQTIIGAKGFTPADVICPAPLMPDGSPCKDADVIDLVTELNEFGELVTYAVVNATKLQAKLDAEAAAQATEQARQLAMTQRRQRIKAAYQHMGALTNAQVKELLKDMILEMKRLATEAEL